MNSENQVAVLQQIFPQQQGPEPHLRSSHSGSHFEVGSESVASTPFGKRSPPNLKRSPLPPCQQAAPSPFVSARLQIPDCKDNLQQGSENNEEGSDRSASWYSQPQPVADRQSSEASEASISPLTAIQNAVNTLGSGLAWWGSYITDFVADVAGDNDLTDEEIAEAEKQKQAAKKASLENQGSVTGDLAQPLTRRHSRSNSGMSRAMSRASLRLDGDWQISPNKSPSKHSIHEDHTESDLDDDDDQAVKKDS